MAGMAIAIMSQSTVVPAGAAAPDSPNSPREDVFHTNTRPTPPHRSSPPSLTPNPASYPEPTISIQRGTTPQQWFDSLDILVAFYRPNRDQQMTISMGFDNEVEHVTVYCNTLAAVAKNYRKLVRRMKSMPIPDTIPEARSLRDNSVTWYSNAALLYEDMSRPRPAARTKEELQSMLTDISDRSLSLKESFGRLEMLDKDMRLHYSVTPPKYDDALNEYTRKSRPFGI